MKSSYGYQRRSDFNDGEFLLVRGAARAFLWAGPRHGDGGVWTLSGPASLRRLAKAILAEVPEPKPRKRKAKP